MPERNSTLRQIVRGHFDSHIVPCNDLDTVLSHLATGICNEGVSIVQVHAIPGIWKNFFDLPLHFDKVFFAQRMSLVMACGLIS